MTSPDPDRLRDELVLLLELQLSALEKEALGAVTVSEILLYERRQERISDLCSQLMSSHAAAA
jgi:hypothetical protein